MIVPKVNYNVARYNEKQDYITNGNRRLYNYNNNADNYCQKCKTKTRGASLLEICEYNFHLLW